MKYFIVFMFLTGCCSLRHPLDGKAASACKRRALAETFCEERGSRLGSDPNYAGFICADGYKLDGCIYKCKGIQQ